ncbi:MAG: efflux RND transporter periplasmic adaptor subunit [Acidobacteria bacterium]|nr:efflux RND transporter periplasmic adaptor subunit [Acidobacteriota bacterium]
MADLNDLAALRLDRRARTSRSSGRVWTVAIALAIIAAATGGWWWSTRAQAATVHTASVVAQSEGGAEGQTVLNASGYVTARRRATVSSKITGKVIEVLVEEGMRVRAGQVLARLDDSMTRATLALVEAQLAASRTDLAENRVRLAEAQLRLDRQKRLAAEGITPQSDLDTAQAEVDAIRARGAAAEQNVVVAERQVSVRRTELADSVIRAPFDGVAITKDAQPGEMISPVSAGGGFTRTGICTIVDMSSLEIEVDVNEAYIQRVTPGQRVTAVLDAYPDWSIPARVITTVPAADRQKATVLVRIDFEKLDPRLLPDMGVKVSFLREPAAGEATAGEAVRPKVMVPKKAVRSTDGTDFVFVVREGLAERRAVRVGSASGDQVEVLSGLTAGERVVVEGPADLSDGARVEEASRS